MARAEDGRRAVTGDDFWRRYDAALPVSAYPIGLKIATLPSAVGETVAEAERALGGDAVVAASAAAGVIRVGVPRVNVEAMAAATATLRALVAPGGGTVVIERAPRDVREAIDPWGPVDSGALALMRALKAEFDPRRLLNAGRFVGAL